MIIGGPPCQGFSNKGKNLGLKDPRNFLFLVIYRDSKSLKTRNFYH
nr:DNA cytosine methyltransferase [Helicobacter pylori]